MICSLPRPAPGQGVDIAELDAELNLLEGAPGRDLSLDASAGAQAIAAFQQHYKEQACTICTLMSSPAPEPKYIIIIHHYLLLYFTYFTFAFYKPFCVPLHMT